MGSQLRTPDQATPLDGDGASFHIVDPCRCASARATLAGILLAKFGEALGFGTGLVFAKEAATLYSLEVANLLAGGGQRP